MRLPKSSMKNRGLKNKSEVILEPKGNNTSMKLMYGNKK